jgi:hydroxymethylglutaryl-CoA lyase
VHPKQVPQMADAERILESVRQEPGVAYTGVYLNDVGLRRAMNAPKLTLIPDIVLSASEAFALRNQKRTLADDVAAARRMAAVYQELGLKVTVGNIMAAFGCNYEGAISLDRVLDRFSILSDIALETGGRLELVNLADTMGWADPALIRRTVTAIRERAPDVRISLHLHDTRGLAIANVYAALLEGVDRFETAVGGLGGCPFANQKGAAGNVATEEVVFLCARLGIETGTDLGLLLRASAVAERVVGHPLPSRLARAASF